jgi:rhamnose utilization protein RhaD (predicted bifunctional aldolase and dehydrogenase)/NAD(P)-dependent dehydrogenase (short-subunit alcohol dehydrogenase family)
VNAAWDDAAAATLGSDDRSRLVYACRLLGADRSVVLPGGGDASVKATGRDLFGEPVGVVHVTGAGTDLATAHGDDLAALRLERVLLLATLTEADDRLLAGELRAASLDPRAPAPAAGAILHALLPHRFVLRSHADAVLALTDTPEGVALAQDTFGPDVLVVPYAPPGLALAKLCAERLAEGADRPDVQGLVLARHGLVTFADDAREAYERHVALVARARSRVDDAWAAAPPPAPPAAAPAADHGGDDSAFGTGDPEPRPVAAGAHGDLATLRRDLSAAAGRPMVLSRWRGEDADRFSARPDLGRVTQAGPAAPDLLRRTGRVPLLGRDVARYAAAYRGDVAHHRARQGDRPLPELDAAPRVVVDAALGVLAAGAGADDAAATAEAYAHTAWVIERAEALGGYAPPTAGEALAAELRCPDEPDPARAPFAGRVALVTGAAAGAGRAAARALIDAGAAVVGLDPDAAVGEVATGPAFRAVTGDAADGAAVDRALAAAIEGFGGLDVLVLCSAPCAPTRPVAELDPAEWQRTVAAAAGSVALALRAAHPYLRVSPVGGSVAVVAPDPDAAPTAAVTRLARAAAVEWAADRVRVNAVHPAAGAASRQVATAVVALCGDGFARTTGAAVTVDGDVRGV